MKKYFNDTKTYNTFRALGAKAPGRKRTAFYGRLYRAYMAKQTSVENLPTFKLTEDDVRAVWEELSTNDHVYGEGD